MRNKLSNRFTTTTKTNIKEEPLYVCICGGSVGYRERSAGVKLLKIHEGSSILEHQVATIQKAFPDAVITVVAGFEADKVIRHRPQISLIENQLYETTGPLEELRLFLNTCFPFRLLIIDGPVFFNHHSLKFIEFDDGNILKYDNDNPKEIGVQSVNNIVEHFGYGIKDKWSGLVYLEGKQIECLKRIVKRENNKLSIFEGLNLLLEQNIVLRSTGNHRAEICRL